MADRSAIEWTHSTFNPWIGCTKVSPACDHCYAEVSTPSRTRGVEWGAGKPRQRTSAGNWKLPLRWNAEPFYTCGCGYHGTMHDMTTNAIHGCGLQFRRVRRRVFCASLADVFDNEVNPSWRIDLFGLIEQTPNLDWLLLTKRIGNANAMIEQAMTGALSHALPRKIAKWPLPNVWLGATICNQAEADRDIPKLLAVPSAVRFLSIEPMLGPIDLDAFPIYGPDREQLLHWVIAGGESGSHARPSHPYWFRSLRDQCAAARVPFLFNQWGEWGPRAGRLFGSGEDFQSIDPECKRWPDIIRLGEHGRDTRICENCTPDMGEEVFMQKVGKKTAGRMLEGAQHDGYPEVVRADH
jgi:protein gp37